MRQLPSIKTLRRIAGERANELRRVLESSDIFTMLEQYPVTRQWVQSCYHRPGPRAVKLAIADEILGTYGVEHINAGRGAKSPAIDYCNAGDTYTETLMYIHFRGFRVGDWGTIVERGNYS